MGMGTAEMGIDKTATATFYKSSGPAMAQSVTSYVRNEYNYFKS